jgi:hypothetical protein
VTSECVHASQFIFARQANSGFPRRRNKFLAAGVVLLLSILSNKALAFGHGPRPAEAILLWVRFHAQGSETKWLRALGVIPLDNSFSKNSIKP